MILHDKITWGNGNDSLVEKKVFNDLALQLLKEQMVIHEMSDSYILRSYEQINHLHEKLKEKVVCKHPS